MHPFWKIVEFSGVEMVDKWGASMATDNFQIRVSCYSYWRDHVGSCDLGGPRKETWLITVDVETFFSSKYVLHKYFHPFVHTYLYQVTPGFDNSNSTGSVDGHSTGAQWISFLPEKRATKKTTKFGEGGQLAILARLDRKVQNNLIGFSMFVWFRIALVNCVGKRRKFQAVIGLDKLQCVLARKR